LAEELQALESAGVPYEIVPGVTAAQAASSHAGIPLTQRDEASCVAFVTGQETHDKSAAKPLDYAALAKFPGTLVFYMGITTAPQWSRALIGHGKSAATPGGAPPPVQAVAASRRRAPISGTNGTAITHAKINAPPAN